MSASQARLRADVTFLADDAREGRAPGSEGIEAAADYIAAAFKDAGLKPAADADGYFQKFSIAGNPRLGMPQQLAFAGPDGKSIDAELKKDFSTLAIGSGGKVEGLPIVFAGYGITANDKDLHLEYDDYGPIDAKGKAVLILRREPQQDKDDSLFSGKQTTSLRVLRAQDLECVPARRSGRVAGERRLGGEGRQGR